MNKKCPHCDSEDIQIVEYMDIKCVVCNHCGFDERKEYDVYPEDKSNQKEKGRYNVYQTGGSRRTK